MKASPACLPLPLYLGLPRDSPALPELTSQAPALQPSLTTASCSLSTLSHQPIRTQLTTCPPGVPNSLPIGRRLTGASCCSRSWKFPEGSCQDPKINTSGTRNQTSSPNGPQNRCWEGRGLNEGLND